jgi:anion-transporting  ArsA/GET3 family ATPase
MDTFNSLKEMTEKVQSERLPDQVSLLTSPTHTTFLLVEHPEESAFPILQFSVVVNEELKVIKLYFIRATSKRMLNAEIRQNAT